MFPIVPLRNFYHQVYSPKRKYGVIEDQGDGLLLTFIFNYDVSSFDIAGIHLKNINDVEEDLQYIYVGLYEGDDLVINKRDHSINIINHESKVEEKCASNSERFLSNLLEIDRFNLIDNKDNYSGFYKIK